MAFKIVCNRCKATITGKNELHAEQLWGDHKCKDKRPLSDLPLPLLREVAYGRLTEEAAFAQLDKEADATWQLQHGG
jgi:hypothetical protein